MVTYTFEIRGNKPWVNVYEKVQRKRWDALTLAARKVVYKVLHNRAMLASIVGRNVNEWLETVKPLRLGYVYTYEFLDFSILITRSNLGSSSAE